MADDRPPPGSAEIEARLLEFIRDELLDPGTSVDREDDLLSGELFESVGMLRLAAFVEEEFALGLQPADYVIENFRNVKVLAGFIHRASGRAGGEPADAGR